MYIFTSLKNRFTLVDIGNAGRQSGGGVFTNSVFGQAIENSTIHIPKISPLPGTTCQNYPYVIVATKPPSQ